MRRLAATIFLTLALAAPLAGAADFSIDIRNFSFQPRLLAAEAGDTVTWTNADAAPHTVTCESGSCPYFSDFLSLGESFTVVLEGSGTQRYFCNVHPDMRGRLHVGSADETDPDLAPVAGSLDASRAELVVQGIPLPHPTMAVLTVDVENRGDRPSAPTLVEFRVVEPTGLRTLASAALAALAAGERATVSVEWEQAPLAGEAEVSAIVDPANAVSEGWETNNALTGHVRPGVA